MLVLLFSLACFPAGEMQASEKPGIPAKSTDRPLAFSIRNPVLEVFTGAWCGYCPDGRVQVDQVESTVSNAIVVERHISDGMETPVNLELADYYGPVYPQGLADRGGAPISRSNWQTSMLNSAQSAAVVQLQFLDVFYFEPTRKISGTLEMTFTSDLTGDFWPNVWIVEDVVTGAGGDYDQANFDNATPGHPFSGAGNPIIGYEHKHVARGETDGAWGRAGVVPAVVGFGESYTMSFAFTLDPGIDETRVRLVGVLSEYGPFLADRMILNATRKRLLETVFANGFE